MTGTPITFGPARQAEGRMNAPDSNAARLLVLRHFLDSGLTLKEAVKRTNEYFRG